MLGVHTRNAVSRSERRLKHSPFNSPTFVACSIEDEANYYRLHVDGFSGTVEDSFAWYHNKRSFSTPDSGNICAEISHGGWWYHQCFFSNLNGVYYKVKWRDEGARWFFSNPNGVYYKERWRNEDMDVST